LENKPLPPERSTRISPLECFTSNRLDLSFKYIYGQAVLSQSTSEYPLKVYKNHLFVITGGNGKFIEYGNNPAKEGFDTFVETFHSLLHGKAKDFPSVRVDRELKLNNGAHRVVAALLQRQMISVVFDEAPRGISADYSFFQKNNTLRYRLNQVDLDYALLKLAELNQNIKILVVYPSVRNHALFDELRLYKEFFLERNFRLNVVAKRKILQFLYPETENFVNLNARNLENAFRDRFNAPGKLRIFFFESRDDNFVTNLKLELRSKYSLPTGSLHTQDNHKESMNLLEVLLNKNSRRNLHNFDLNFAKTIQRNLSRFSEIDANVCVVGSSPLNLLSIRKSRDLDLLSRHEGLISENSGLDLHNQYWKKMGFNVDDILDNPRNFITIFGVKYVSCLNLIWFKIRRHEKKDLLDIAKIIRHKMLGLLLVFPTFRHYLKGHLRTLKSEFLIRAR
jgi:hypothetical protein